MIDQPTRRRDTLKPWRRFRSAVTGEFVSRWFALANPRETISERVARKR